MIIFNMVPTGNQQHFFVDGGSGYLSLAPKPSTPPQDGSAGPSCISERTGFSCFAPGLGDDSRAFGS